MKKTGNSSLQEILSELPLDLQIRTRLSLGIAGRIEFLMRQKGLTKKQFAEALGRNPSEITKWLSGEHNFTISSLSMLSAFFGKPIIEIPADDSQVEDK